MLLSPSLLERLRTELTERPLSSGETRRIEGMGNHYISRIPFESGIAAPGAGGEYLPLVSLEIDGQPCFVYFRTGGET